MILMTSHNNQAQCHLAVSLVAHASHRAGFQTTVFLANSGQPIFDHGFKMMGLETDEFSTPEDTFWAKGMRLAWERSMASRAEFDFVLWLNDDTLVNDNSLQELYRTLMDQKLEVIAVGSCTGELGELTYGGLRRGGWHNRLHLNLVYPTDVPVVCDTFNGNLVFMKRETALVLGGFPRGYTHLRADIAYGFNSNGIGISTVVSPGNLAVCKKNSSYQSYADLKHMRLIDRLRVIDSPKFGPLREHMRFSLRYGGPLGFAYALAPFFRALISR
jgi:GT2 family glycosyltransferase